MGWLDDARKKAEEKADEAKSKAQEKAAEAAVAAAGAAVKKSVGGFFEGLISSAEASLAEAEENARARGLKLDGPDLDGSEELESQIREPEADPLGEAVRRAEAVAWEEPTPAPVVTAPVDLPEPPPRSTDPFADAYAAIAKAREARGAGPEEPVLARDASVDPVEAALAAAREARAFASGGGSRAQEREASARAQLEAMKAARGGGGAASSPATSSAPDDSDDDGLAKPKKRTL